MRGLFAFAPRTGERKASKAKLSKRVAALFLTFLVLGLFSSAVLVPVGTASAETAPDSGWLLWLCSGSPVQYSSGGAVYFNDGNGHTGHCYFKPIPGSSPTHNTTQTSVTDAVNNCNNSVGSSVTFNVSNTNSTTYTASAGFTVKTSFFDAYDASVNASFSYAWGYSTTRGENITDNISAYHWGEILYVVDHTQVKMGADVWFNDPIDGHYNWLEYEAGNAPYISSDQPNDNGYYYPGNWVC